MSKIRVSYQIVIEVDKTIEESDGLVEFLSMSDAISPMIETLRLTNNIRCVSESKVKEGCKAVEWEDDEEETG